MRDAQYFLNNTKESGDCQSEIYHCHMLRDEGYTYKEIGAALQITWKRVDYIINKLSLK